MSEDNSGRGPSNDSSDWRQNIGGLFGLLAILWIVAFLRARFDFVLSMVFLWREVKWLGTWFLLVPMGVALGLALAIVLGIGLPLGAACFVWGLLRGVFLGVWAMFREEDPRVSGGAQVGRSHWAGARWGVALDACVEAQQKFERDAKVFQHANSDDSRRIAFSMATMAMNFGMVAGAFAYTMVYWIVLAVWVSMAWGVRFPFAAWLRGWVRARRVPRECGRCHGWTASPAWRCPKCGAAHRQIEPSSKFGVLWWRCACGAWLPTLSALGRRRLEEECPKCGGKLEGVGRTPMAIAFLEGEGAERTWLWQASAETLAGGAGNIEGWRVSMPSVKAEEFPVAELGANVLPLGFWVRRGGNLRRFLRVYGIPERVLGTPSELARQGLWAQVATLVFAVSPADLDAAETAFNSWLCVMEREFPGRVERMVCALALTQPDTPDVVCATGLAPGAGDSDCREFLRRCRGGNLLNSLDARFRRVRVFAVGEGSGDGLGALWRWTLEKANGARLPRSVRMPGGESIRPGEHGKREYEGASLSTGHSLEGRWHGFAVCCGLTVSLLFWGTLLGWGVKWIIEKWGW